MSEEQSSSKNSVRRVVLASFVGTAITKGEKTPPSPDRLTNRSSTSIQENSISAGTARPDHQETPRLENESRHAQGLERDSAGVG